MRKNSKEKYKTGDGCDITVTRRNVPHLNERFNRFNRRLFGGRLPGFIVQFGEVYRGTADLVDGHCDNERKVITLSFHHYCSQLSSLKACRRWVRQVLLHEMCHIGTEPGHGKQFLTELKRLLKKGEKWAAEETQIFEDRRGDSGR